MSNPLDASDNSITNAKKIKRRNKYIIGFVLFLAISIALLAAYIQSVEKMAELSKSRPPSNKQSTVDTSSASLAKQKNEHKKTPDSPTMLSVKQDEKLAKDAATINGVSHINNTDVLSDKGEVKIDANSASKNEPVDETNVVEAKTTKEVQPKSEEQKPKLSRSEIVKRNLNKLFAGELPSHYPQAINVTNYVQNFENKYTTGATENLISLEDLIMKNEFVTTVKEDNLKKIQDELAMKDSSQSNNADVEDENNPELVRVINMGDIAVGQIKEAINSDFNLDVFIDLQDAPLKNARIRASFQLTDAQDGIVLKANQIQVGDHVQAIDGYAVDVTIDNSPLFDNDVDTHFVKKFAARASAAFIVPWIDFITATTTTITGDTIVIDNPTVDSTKDRMIGSLASVAKEFIPDLRKNANIPSTVSVPKNYPVGVVFADALYLPMGLFDDDPETNPDRSYDKVFADMY